VRDQGVTVGERVLTVFDPSCGDVLAEVERESADDLEEKLELARGGAGRWQRLSLEERIAALAAVGDLIEREAEELARLETRNVGKPIRESRAEVGLAARTFRYYAGAADKIFGQTIPAGPDALHYTVRQPFGVVAAIVPWNFPTTLLCNKLGPALLCGNTVVAKPADTTPLTTLRLREILGEAGLPPGVLNVVTGRGAEIGPALIGHPDVRMVCLTGDTETGRRVMREAADGLKRLHLELGGKAPFVVFDDADLEAAARGAVAGATINCGQDCTAATRAYVQEPLYDAFVAAVADLAGSLVLGPTLERSTDMGPLISSAQRDRVEGFVERARSDGAKVLVGGSRPTAPGTERGWYYEPTVVVDVGQDAEIVQQEVFGPVLVVLPFREDEDAIRMANDCAYGLSSSVWTRDVYRALDASRRLEFGNTWINDHIPIVSEMPHGGVKHSGFGKDMSTYALEDFTTVRHVMADISGAARKDWHAAVMGGGTA
jgi:betaine-aldehyde dehydrogenase